MRQRTIVALVAVAAIAAGFLSYQRAEVLTDSVVILSGVGTIDRCLDAGITSNCNAAGLGDVGYFPPFQYVPAWVMKHAHLTKGRAASGLAAISGAAFVLLIALGWLVLARVGAGAAGPLFAAGCLASCLLWYSTTTFGESLGALLTLALAACVLLRPHLGLVVLAAFAAALTKETAVPFLALLAVACLLARPRADWRRVAVAVAAGLVIGVAADAWLNVFRYGHVWNDFYVPSSRPGACLWPGIGSAMLVAPNVGILWFCGPLLALAGAGIAAARPRTASRRVRLVLVAAGLQLVALLVFFTTWYAPFGWQAWGPRLIIAWLPALVLVTLAAEPAASARGAAALVATPRRIAGVVAVLALFGLPQLGALLDKKLPFRLFDDPCVGRVHGNDTYYPCLSHLAWSAKPVLLRAYGSLAHGGRMLVALCFVAALSALAGAAAKWAVKESNLQPWD